VPRVRLRKCALLDEPPDAGLRIGADDDGQVLPGPEPALYEERHVVDRDGLDIRRGSLLAHSGRDRRTGDPVEVGQRLRVRKHDRRQCGPVQSPVGPDQLGAEALGDPGQGRGTRLDHLAGHHVGIDDVRPEVAKRSRHCRLARTDAPGEADVEHLATLVPSAAAAVWGCPHPTVRRP
jgi:hypothetical protein